MFIRSFLQGIKTVNGNFIATGLALMRE